MPFGKKIKKKSFFFQNKKNGNFGAEKKFCHKKNIYKISFFIFPFKEVSIRPELSSPPRFRIQGGWSERCGRRRRNGNPCV